MFSALVNKKILSIDIDYCLDTHDMVEVFDLFIKTLHSINDRSRVVISQYHADILDMLNSIDGDLDVYNVDLHHDIFYEKEVSIAEVRAGVAGSSDWGLWTALNLNLNSYTWIKQPCSEEFSEEMMELFCGAYHKDKSYDIIDSRNVLFTSKLAFTHKVDSFCIKQKPPIAVETRLTKEILDIDFDYLFLCLSPEYTPKENYFFYEICKSAYSSHFAKT